MLSGLLLLLAFSLVFFTGPWVARFCCNRGLIVPIDSRRVHVRPIPHGGGVVMVGGGVVLGFVALQILVLPYENYLQTMLIASLAVSAVGWLDDHKHLSGLVRLLVHVSAVVVGALLLPPMVDSVPDWLEKIVMILAWVWFVNLFNFMDGTDGQSSVEAIFIAIGLALLAPEIGPLAAIVAGCALGFLRMNWPNAKVFMGDVGSTWLGYVIGGLIFLALTSDFWRLVYPVATLTLFFSADATWTLCRRVAQGYSPLEPHRTFWFHRALSLVGTSENRGKHWIVWFILINCILFAVAMMGYAYDMGWGTAALGLSILLLGAGWIYWKERQQKSGASV